MMRLVQHSPVVAVRLQELAVGCRALALVALTLGNDAANLFQVRFRCIFVL